MPFICVYGLIVLARNSSTHGIEVLRMDTFVLFVVREEKLPAFHCMVIAVGFLYVAFIMLRYVSSVYIVEDFFYKRMSDFIKCDMTI